MVKLPGVDCDWYATGHGQRGDRAGDGEGGELRRRRVGAEGCAAARCRERPMNIRPDRLCRSDHAAQADEPEKGKTEVVVADLRALQVESAIEQRFWVKNAPFGGNNQPNRPRLSTPYCTAAATRGPPR